MPVFSETVVKCGHVTIRMLQMAVHVGWLLSVQLGMM